MKTIEINVKNPKLAKIEDLHPIQGDLKSLSKENFEKLKSAILDLGFAEPVTCWRDKKNKLYTLNGHQRLRCVNMLIQDGYHIDGIPIVEVTAPSKKDAVKLCLTLASSYGEANDEGLYALMEHNNIDFDFLSEKVSFPEIDLNEFKEGYLDLADNKETSEDETEVKTCEYCYQPLKNKR